MLVLMGVAVILILAGAGSVGLAFGLVVAGAAGIMLVSMMFYDVANSNGRDWSREDRLYRRSHARGF